MFACHGRQKFSVSHQANDGSRAERAGAVVADSEQGELPVLFCFMFLLIMFYGPGRWSIDSLLKGPLERATPSSS
jgi:uncharacterized membrane protein YphA (DoxX/SURF4 family)